MGVVKNSQTTYTQVTDISENIVEEGLLRPNEGMKELNLSLGGGMRSLRTAKGRQRGVCPMKRPRVGSSIVEGKLKKGMPG